MYDLVGACELISRETCETLGYVLDEYFIDCPVLVFSKNGNYQKEVYFLNIQIQKPKKQQ